MASQHLRSRRVRCVHGPFDLVVRHRMARPDVLMVHVDLQSRQGVGHAARRPASRGCHLAVAMGDLAGQDGRWPVGVEFDHAVAGIELRLA